MFDLGEILIVIDVKCIIRSSGRKEKIKIEGKRNYVKKEKKK